MLPMIIAHLFFTLINLYLPFFEVLSNRLTCISSLEANSPEINITNTIDTVTKIIISLL